MKRKNKNIFSNKSVSDYKQQKGVLFLHKRIECLSINRKNYSFLHQTIVLCTISSPFSLLHSFSLSHRTAQEGGRHLLTLLNFNILFRCSLEWKSTDIDISDFPRSLSFATCYQTTSENNAKSERKRGDENIWNNAQAHFTEINFPVKSNYFFSTKTERIQKKNNKNC